MMSANSRIQDEESCPQPQYSTQRPWARSFATLTAVPNRLHASPKKLAAWERSNGVGRLVKKEPPRPYPTWTAPASFTLHEGPVVDGAGDVAALLGVAPRTARATMKSILDDGVVGSEPPQGALMTRFPSKNHDVLFPRLFDLT